MQFPNPFENDLIIPMIIKYLELSEIKNARLVSKRWNHHILYAIKKEKINLRILAKIKKVTINDDIAKFNKTFCYNANGDPKSDQDREDSMFFTHFTISNSVFLEEELEAGKFIHNFGEKIINLKLKVDDVYQFISGHFTRGNPISFPNLKYLNFNLKIKEDPEHYWNRNMFLLSCLYPEDLFEEQDPCLLQLQSLEEVHFTHNTASFVEPYYLIDFVVYKFFARNAPKLISINLPIQNKSPLYGVVSKSVNERFFFKTYDEECRYICNLKELYLEEINHSIVDYLIQWSDSKDLRLRKFHFAQMDGDPDFNRVIDLEHFVQFINYQKDTLEEFSFNSNWTNYSPVAIDLNFFESFQQTQFTQLKTLELINNYLPGEILKTSNFPALKSLSLSNYCHPNGHEFMDYISLWDQMPNLKCLKLLKFESISETLAKEYFFKLAEKFPNLEILEFNVHILSPLYENIEYLWANWNHSMKELTIRFQNKSEFFCPARLSKEYLLKLNPQISGKESEELLLKTGKYSNDNDNRCPVAQMRSLEILRWVGGQVFITDIVGYSICRIKLKVFEVSKEISLLSKECIEVLNMNNIEVNIV